MEKSTKSITLLMADDDPDDRMLAGDALKEARLGNEMFYVQDGEELLDYLHTVANILIFLNHLVQV